jgi:hypothetical protein
MAFSQDTGFRRKLERYVGISENSYRYTRRLNSSLCHHLEEMII